MGIEESLHTHRKDSLGRVPHNHRVVRELASHNTSGSHNTVISYGGTRQYCAIISNKDIIPDYNPSKDICIFDFVPEAPYCTIMGYEISAGCYGHMITNIN